MGALNAILKVVIGLATPENIQSAKTIIGALVSLGAIVKDDGAKVTIAELDALWDELEAELQRLGDAARASNARILGSGGTA